MATSSFFWISLLVFCPPTSFASEATDLSSSQNVAKIIRLTGEAWVQTPTGEKKALQLNDPVLDDASLHTGEKSSITVGLKDQSILTLGSNSHVDLAIKKELPDQVDLHLREGILKSLVKKRIDTNRWFKVHTRAATMGVRGTEFITKVLMDASQVSHEELIVLHGSVQVSDSSGKELAMVKKGMSLGFTSFNGPQGPKLERPEQLKPKPIDQKQTEQLKKMEPLLYQPQHSTGAPGNMNNMKEMKDFNKPSMPQKNATGLGLPPKLAPHRSAPHVGIPKAPPQVPGAGFDKPVIGPNVPPKPPLPKPKPTNP